MASVEEDKEVMDYFLKRFEEKIKCLEVGISKIVDENFEELLL